MDQLIPVARGSIPASAGERSRSPSAIGCSGVYPRERGGTLNISNGFGSACPVGSIPASAGERCLATIIVIQVVGLSPRARGNVFDGRVANSLAGSIPASAGERLPCVMRPWLGLGLSPRARGNGRICGADSVRDGSIPASAGERLIEPGPRSATVVYPRERGGTFGTNWRMPNHWGLSPRARGNVRTMGLGQSFFGSIPASAGERANDGFGARASSGLSPRARGNEYRCGLMNRRDGSIPASAGERLRK